MGVRRAGVEVAKGDPKKLRALAERRHLAVQLVPCPARGQREEWPFARGWTWWQGKRELERKRVTDASSKTNTLSMCNCICNYFWEVSR